MRAICILAILAIAATASEITSFNDFMSRYNKVYTHDEFAHRRQIFEENLAEINQINSENRGWTAGVNEWSDLSWEEFKAKFLMAPQKCSATKGNHVMSENPNPDPVIDWRTKNVVTPVKNQGSCGSCWAFSTTGAIESASAIKTGKLQTVAEQQLVDCAQGFDNHGCRGGLPSQAFQYVMWAGGIQDSASYPYTGRDGRCNFKKDKVIIKLANEVNITERAENELVDAINTKGPVSVAYQVSSDFRSYRSGVYDSRQCRSGPMDVNHAVLAVGLNTTTDGKPYYIIKNSWGTSFGIQGYFWMIRNKNMCGVATCSSYPVV
jgi:cathepsin H